MPAPSASIRNSITLSDTAGNGSLELANTPSTRRNRLSLGRSFLGDTLAIAIILATVNYFLFWDDPCWLKSNPTPLLLLPILIGGRYGFGAGLFSGLLTSCLVIATMNHLGIEPSVLLHSNTLTLVSFPLVGLLCGEIHNFFKARTTALTARCEQFEALNNRNAANLELFADSNASLQQRLAVHGVRFTSLDSELRRLLAPSDNDMFTDALGLLNRITEVSEAAFYTVENKRLLKRIALLGNGDELPDSLRPDRVEIIDQALAEKQMVTCRELWGDTPQLFSRHLAAIPLMDPHGEVGAILLVRRLPFHCVTWQHFAQLETICAWIAQYSNLKDSKSTTADSDVYKNTITLCIDTYRRHALPSAAVHFVADDDTELSQSKLHDAIAPLLRSTDLTTRLDGKNPNLAVLLPMEGRDGAQRLIEQVSSKLNISVKTKITQTEELDSAERFMNRLEQSN